MRRKERGIAKKIQKWQSLDRHRRNSSMQEESMSDGCRIDTNLRVVGYPCYKQACIQIRRHGPRNGKVDHMCCDQVAV
jgi:hypothetical protein